MKAHYLIISVHSCSIFPCLYPQSYFSMYRLLLEEVLPVWLAYLFPVVDNTIRDRARDLRLVPWIQDYDGDIYTVA